MKYSNAFLAALLFAFACATTGCTEEVGNGGDPTSSSTGTPGDNGKPLQVTVPESGRVFARLSTPEIVTPPDDGMSSTEWDMAFSGYDVFTNSGLSGPGEGGAFGPLDVADFDAGRAPSIPFLTEDDAGGAFYDWFAYDGSVHVVYSRYHVFGIEEAGRYWKVQILGFYGDVEGAPVAAIYRIRWAEVLGTGSGPTTELADIDATAGGSDAPDSVPSECVDLDTGARLMLTPAEAKASAEWHLCFRRAAIRVNGELGGPRGVRASDLHLAETASENVAIVKERTPESELARFDAVDWAEATDAKHVYRGDRIITAFSDLWTEPGASPPEPRAGVSWLVQSPDGATRYLVVFDTFEGATDATPGIVNLRVKREQ